VLARYKDTEKKLKLIVAKGCKVSLLGRNWLSVFNWIGKKYSM
jgi:hypothetical protein